LNGGEVRRSGLGCLAQVVLSSPFGNILRLLAKRRGQDRSSAGQTRRVYSLLPQCGVRGVHNNWALLSVDIPRNQNSLLSIRQVLHPLPACARRTSAPPPDFELLVPPSIPVSTPGLVRNNSSELQRGSHISLRDGHGLHYPPRQVSAKKSHP
jgi:hypothetical protein